MTTPTFPSARYAESLPEAPRGTMVCNRSWTPGTNEFLACIGIGRDVNPEVPLDVFVLNPWTEPERAMLRDIIGHAVHEIEEIIAKM